MMQRVLESDALHIQRRISEPPVGWRQSTLRRKVLLLDEKASSRADFCTRVDARLTAFQAMLAAAESLQDTELWLLRSADYGKGPWLSSKVCLPAGMQTFDTTHSLRELLQSTDTVYTVGASEGMAAMLASKQVHVFGQPYYSGWGLTHDHANLPSRSARPSLEALFEAVFLNAAHYLDPRTLRQGSLESALDCIELQREVASRFADLSNVAAAAFQLWKRPFATPFITAGGGTLRWVSKCQHVRSSETAAIWGGRNAAGLPEGTKFFRIEDGFLHSLGLGSDMFAPHSQVIDRSGIYFDASHPNELTAILNNAKFLPQELRRAAALRASIVQHGLTKYNLGRRKPSWELPQGKRLLLVPGQVADDASIRLGTRGIATAEALLNEVRENRPDAFIIYKPHPDVLSGNRDGLVTATKIADIVDTTSDLISLIDVADEIHTLSSLSGYEALIRGKQVYTYGLPFYAGWGLTEDALPQPWRERVLAIDELVAGVMLRYPLYWDWELGLFTTPEAVVERLAGPASRPLSQLRGSRQRQVIKIFRWGRNVFLHFLQKRVPKSCPGKPKY
ncbi:MAG: capsular biosynthesis protein [Burkholderia gladioli]